MSRIINVAGIQILCDKCKDDMRKKAEHYIEQAKLNCSKLDLVVLPEQFYQMDCYSFEGEEYGEEEHGLFEEWISNVARKYEINIIAGSYPVRNKNNKIYNRCLVVDREGQIKGHYDKIHLFDAFGIKESDTFDAGNELGLFDLDIGKVGVWICYDTRFPELARALSNRGADLFCVPAAFYKPNSDQWEIMLKSAAIYNITPIIAVNQYGSLPNGSGFFGRSMVVDQKGIITAGMSDREGYFIGQIDLDYSVQCRQANPQLQNQRRDLYKNWISDLS